jgi:hypothetical protein
VVLGLVLLFSARCLYRAYLGPPLVSVVNRSPHVLSDARLRGQGFSQLIGSIQAGETVSVIVHPVGESDLEIAFTGDGRHVVKRDLAYLEASGGYCVTLVVDSQLQVQPSGGGSCFTLRRAV